jgi:hypothetical protein
MPVQAGQRLRAGFEADLTRYVAIGLRVQVRARQLWVAKEPLMTSASCVKSPYQAGSTFTLVLTLLIAAGCAGDRPTGPGADHYTESSSDALVGEFVDDFTDADGTLLHNHTPDGGGQPFSWRQVASWGNPWAFIQDNALNARTFEDWVYVTSGQTGDQAELLVDVTGDITDGGQEIAIWLRTVDADAGDGYAVLWSFSPGVNYVSVQRRSLPSVIVTRPGGVPVGQYVFRALINARGEMEVRINGELVVTAPLGALVPPGRAGMGTWTNTTPVARITAFAAVPPCPPTGDPVLDDPAVRRVMQEELALSRPSPEWGSSRTERRGYVYLKDDGTYIFVPANDDTGTMCGFTFEDLPIPPNIEGATFKGDYHTHPNKHLEPLTGCLGQAPGEVWKATRKGETGGGSVGDWDFTNVRGQSHYILDIDGRVWRLDPHTLDRKNNPNRWKLSSSGCLEKA